MSKIVENSPLLPSGGFKNNTVQNSHMNFNDQPDIGDGENDGVVHRGGSPHDQTRLPLLRAVFVVTNAALGAGMLNFPEAYSKTGGVAQALTVQALLILLIIGAFLILGYCGKVCQEKTYHDTIKYFCGSIAQIICQVLVAVYMFGSNVTYLILIGDQLTKVINHDGWYFDRRFIIVIVSLLFILPLCLPKKLKVISYSSVFGGLGALYVCLMVVSNYYKGTYKPHDNHTSDFHWTHVFAAVPVICFGFQCHVTSVAVYAELEQPTIKRFGIVTICATAICTLIYSLTGAYGFLTFHHSVKSDILVNYDSDDIAANAGRTIIVVVVFSTYAICHFVGRSAFLGLWIRLWKLTPAQVETFENRRRIITTIVWYLLSLGLSIVVPTIGKAIAVVGAFAAHFIFTFPGLCLIQLIMKDASILGNRRKLGLIIGVTYVTIGVFLFGQTVSLAIMEDVDPRYAF